MQIFQLERIYINFAEAFLKSYEFSCVHLCSLIKKCDSQVYLVVKNNKLTDSSDIFGIFSFDGSIHHCFPNLGENKQDLIDFERIFVSFLKNYNKKIKCINGLSKSTKIILDFLEKENINPFQINNYDLLILSKKIENKTEKLMNDDFIKRCTLDDYDDLLELQKNYLIDEVAPKGRKVSDLETSVILKQILKNQICVGFVSDDQFVAKANTNAIGWNFVQIGGVYTNSLFRRNHYAINLVMFLCNLLISKNKKVCLFVNEKNIPAENLYKKLGFEQKEKFEICYFN